MGPDLIQHPLSRADGSTVLSDGLYTVIAGVNGPIEVQRRDELPEEAAIEVNIRPGSGVGGPRERWLEMIVQSVLKTALLVHLHPRTLVQVTLQVAKEPSISLRRTTADISIIPTLVNSAFTALVDGGLPLATTLTSTLAVVQGNGEIVVEPKEKDLVKHTSIHAMAYNAHGQQLLEESSGSFDLGTWERTTDATQQACLAAMAKTDEDTAMANGEAQSGPWLRQALEEQAQRANFWREGT